MVRSDLKPHFFVAGFHFFRAVVPGVMLIAVILLFLASVLLVATSDERSLRNIPKYYVDPTVQSLLLDDRVKCMMAVSQQALDELEYVRKSSATEYYRSHELFAHNFFIESGDQNPHRAKTYEEAEFEYIPLLSLYWATIPNANTKPKCDYRHFMNSILKVQAYLVARDSKHPTRVKPKFSVASTFNLRTVMGTGMPTQLRKGEAWESVSNFVMALSIGHYERWPQCPDLLRKSFKYVIELPYVTSIPHKASITTKKADTHKQFMNPSRKNVFFFSGNFELFGPEMVCSVRNEIINIASRRNDTLVVNSTYTDANSELHLQKLHAMALNSEFCLIAKSDSYSTSFLYVALQAGCIPVVISDWFVFAFPWLIPYEKFVLRIQEGEFLQNPDFVLDFIANTIGRNKALLYDMRRIMYNYKHILSFEPVVYKPDRFKFESLEQSDVYLTGAVTVGGGGGSGSSGSSANSLTTTSVGNTNTKSKQFRTYLPLELMLLELRYNQHPHQYYNNVPCLRPNACSRDHILNTTFIDKEMDYVFPGKSRLRWIQRIYTDVSGTSGTSGTSDTSGVHTSDSVGSSSVAVKGEQLNADYSVKNDGYQVKAIFIPELMDVRTHLCRHAMRLIGSYKIVFFMQCVRILWPLHPGTFKPVDNVARHLPGFDNTTFVSTVARYRGGKYSIEPDGISRKDMQFVVDFHNATKPEGYRLVNYPVVQDRSRIVSFKDIAFRV